MSPCTVPILGRLAWIDVILLGWFTLVAVSVAYVAWGAFQRLPEPGVIKWAWVLTTLYLGPVGAVFYVLADEDRGRGSTGALWPPVETGAGVDPALCGRGRHRRHRRRDDHRAARPPMWFDMTSRVRLGLAFGLFIFQALFMKNIMGGSYVGALRGSFLPRVDLDERHDGGHVPVMTTFMMGRDMRAMDLTSRSTGASCRWPSASASSLPIRSTGGW